MKMKEFGPSEGAHPWHLPLIRQCQLQPDTSTENILVQCLEWLTAAKQVIWIQFLLKPLNVLYFLFNSSN